VCAPSLALNMVGIIQAWLVVLRFVVVGAWFGLVEADNLQMASQSVGEDIDFPEDLQATHSSSSGGILGLAVSLNQRSNIEQRVGQSLPSVSPDPFAGDKAGAYDESDASSPSGLLNVGLVADSSRSGATLNASSSSSWPSFPHGMPGDDGLSKQDSSDALIDVVAVTDRSSHLTSTSSYIMNSSSHPDEIRMPLDDLSGASFAVSVELAVPVKVDIKADSEPFVDTVMRARSERRLDHVPSAPKKTSFPINLRAGGIGYGDGPWQLNRPYSVYVDTSGQVYVSDTLNHRVQRWAPNNVTAPTTVAGGNGRGRGLNQLNLPRGIFVHAVSGDVFVVDTGNHRVVRWSLGAHEAVVVVGEYGKILDAQGNVVGSEPFCCRAGRGQKQLMGPSGVFVDQLGNIYVADTGNDRVLVWDSGSGAVTTVAGGGGSTPGAPTDASLKRPEGVFVREGTVYVADTGNNRVMAWSIGAPAGSVVAGGQGPGNGIQQLAGPTGVWVDVSLKLQGVVIKRLLVVDMYNHRIMSIRLTSVLSQGPTVAAGECLQSPAYISPCIKGGSHYPPDPRPDRVDHLNPSNTNPPIYHFFGPRGVHITPVGPPGQGRLDITVADTQNHRVLTWLG